MLQILYQDAHMVAVVKPAGVLSEDSGEGSMPALLRQQLGKTYIGCVHRLDRAVGGVMVYALDQPTCGKLSAMVASHQMVKEYMAVVHGCPEPAEGEMRDLLFKDSARNKSFVVKRMRKEIQNVQTRLEAANSLLREEGEVKKRLLSAETNRVLFEQLDRDMERRVASLVNLIQTLPATEHPKSLTAYITLCLCHIKRRCNLFFLARQGEPLLGEELSMYLDELAELARYAGLQILICCGQMGALEVRSAALCYDFAFETISWALKEKASPLMGYLELEKTHLVFRFLPGSDPGQWHFSEELMTAVSALGGQISCKDLDDAVGICMTLPVGGETCG